MESIYFYHHKSKKFNDVPCVYPSWKEKNDSAIKWAQGRNSEANIYCEKVENSFTTIRCAFFSNRYYGGSPLMVILDEKWLCQVRENELLEILNSCDSIKGLIKGSFFFTKDSCGPSLRLNRRKSDDELYNRIVIDENNFKNTKTFLRENFGGKFVLEYVCDFYSTEDFRMFPDYDKLNPKNGRYKVNVPRSLKYITKKGNCYTLDPVFRSSWDRIELISPSWVDYFLSGGTIGVSDYVEIYKEPSCKSYFYYNFLEEFVSQVKGLKEIRDNIEECEEKGIDLFSYYMSVNEHLRVTISTKNNISGKVKILYQNIPLKDETNIFAKHLGKLGDILIKKSKNCYVFGFDLLGQTTELKIYNHGSEFILSVD